MHDDVFKITYRMLKLGALERADATSLPLMDITNYSFAGDIEIAKGDDKIALIDVPLLEAFHAIRQVLKVVPIFTRSAPYAQMFREARTIFTVESDVLVIEHQEIAALRSRSGSACIRGSYVSFCTSFGAAAKLFIGELERVAPSLFHDEKTMAQFSELFIGAKIKDSDPNVYSVV